MSPENDFPHEFTFGLRDNSVYSMGPDEDRSTVLDADLPRYIRSKIRLRRAESILMISRCKNIELKVDARRLRGDIQRLKKIGKENKERLDN